ncbi:MAG: hypothetical protein VZQ61_05235 [Christensenellaceae bacterium]
MIFLALLLTAFVYLIFPILYVANNGKVGPKKGRRLALWNVFICALIFFIITLIIVASSEENSNAEIGGYSLAPAFFYYFIAKAILTDKNLHDNNETSSTTDDQTEDSNDDLTELEEMDDSDETDNFDDEQLNEENVYENIEEKEGFLNPDSELNNTEQIIDAQKTYKTKNGIENTQMIEINEQKIEEEILKLKNHEFLSKNITFSYKNLTMTKKLEATNAYEGSAFSIYNQGVTLFGFDKNKAKLFKPLQILYAKLVSPEPEYYSVWFLPHSNVNNSTNGTWYNIYEGETIYQCEIDSSSQTHNKPRITFIKQESGDYVFIGIYKFVKDQSWYKDEKRYYVQVYTKIGNIYPVNN